MGKCPQILLVERKSPELPSILVSLLPPEANFEYMKFLSSFLLPFLLSSQLWKQSSFSFDVLGLELRVFLSGKIPNTL